MRVAGYAVAMRGCVCGYARLREVAVMRVMGYAALDDALASEAGYVGAGVA